MKKNFKKISFGTAFIVLMMCMLCFGVSALNTEGKIGEDITYVYDVDNGEVIISGAGDMYDYFYFENQERNEFRSPFFGSNIKSVIITDGVESIGNSAFAACEQLVNIVIPDSVKDIGEGTFWGCANLAEVEIPAGVKELKRGVFGVCDSLSQITVPNGVEIIEDSAFWGCRSLTKATLPDSLSRIGNNAFWGCGLYNITIPANVESIGENTFSECYSLEKVIVDDKNNFYSNDEYGALFNKDKTELIKYPVGRYDVTAYKIPYGVKNIESYAFSFGYALTSIEIPDSVINIEEKAFKECLNVKELKIPDSVTNIAESAFAYWESLERLTVGNSVEKIDSYVFDGCANLKYLTLPISVKYIGVDAFKDSNSVLIVHYLGSKEDFNSIIGIYDADLYDKEIHYLDGTSKEVLSSCINEGFKAEFFCEECNLYFNIYDKVGFSDCVLGEWTLTREPSLLENGIETSVCAVCGEKQIRERPKTQSDAVVKDENTGINIEYASGTYEGEIEVVVVPDFDGSQYVALPIDDFTRIASWNIKTYVNGEEVQPVLPVLVSIPLPEGFNGKYIAVYHIDSQTGKFERIKPVYVEDGYVKFLASSFSVYTVVDESSEENKGIGALIDWLADLLALLTDFIAKVFTFNC